MASGVGVSSNCLDVFQVLKLKKIYQYIIFDLEKNLTEIVVGKTGDKALDKNYEEAYEEFLEVLPPDECRWIVYDFEFEKEEGGRRNKLIFISWSPDSAKIKQKMLFASSRDALRRALTGLSFEIQGSDLSEVSYEAVLERASRGA